MSDRKRHGGDRRSDHRKRPHTSSSPAAGDGKRPSFPSYRDAPDLSPKIRLLCEIVASSPSPAVEATLDDTGVRVTPDDVEEVLRLSYSHPGPAVKFFRWAGGRLNHHHSPYAWNLVVDLLGKNLLFDAMWDAVSSMRDERHLSLATFASIFGSYAAVHRPEDAIAAFDAMKPSYGIPCDAAALNTLLSALCREGRTVAARDFLARVRSRVRPDADTYAIVLEGCENEGDIHGARESFGEMVNTVGWDPVNVPAYDSFLSTLVRRKDGIVEALKFLDLMREHQCYPGMKFFRNALQELVREVDARGAWALWNSLSGRNGCYADTQMYNTMISLQCYANQMDEALKLMDEMVIHGVFPDSETYNLMLQYLLKVRKLRNAAAVFNEMVKNEFCPTATICATAIRIFLDTGDCEMGIKVWKSMVANDLTPMEESANTLVLKLRDNDKLPEACKYAEDMIDKGIKLNSSTLSKLKTNLLKVGKGNIYDELLRKWKGH